MPDLDLTTATEAAARAKWDHDVAQSDIGWGGWDDVPPSTRSLYIEDMRPALHSATPHIIRAVADDIEDKAPAVARLLRTYVIGYPNQENDQ